MHTHCKVLTIRIRACDGEYDRQVEVVLVRRTVVSSHQSCPNDDWWGDLDQSVDIPVRMVASSIQIANA